MTFDELADSDLQAVHARSKQKVLRDHAFMLRLEKTAVLLANGV